MNTLSFKNNSAQRIYNDYIKRCKNATRILSKGDQEDCLLEINSHIYEYLSANHTGDELESLLNILERLGPPEEILKEIVATKKIGEATRTFNPKHLIQALLLNISNGIIYIILFILFLFELCFPVLIVLKIIYPDRTGFFIGNDGNFLFGYHTKSISGGIGAGNYNMDSSTEQLGNWFIPVTIIIALLVYTGIILLLKSIKKIKKK
jgi:uncharacterized membrane protein